MKLKNVNKNNNYKWKPKVEN